MSFDQIYRCYPVSLLNKPHLENGNKVIMPPSALDRLVSDSRVEYPMLFQLSNPGTAGRVTHCGVLEFVAEEGQINLPSRMMKNMGLEEGDFVQVKYKRLKKGRFVKLQPHTKDFLDISNPKVVLERVLRGYSCLTTGDTVTVHYNNKEYLINIIETKPSSAVSIIDTDCEVDFAPPLDYVEPEKKPQKRESSGEEGPEPSEKIAKFIPFTGSARRLDGNPAVTSQSVAAVASSAGFKGSKASTGSGSVQHSGKLVFGRPGIETGKVALKKGREEGSEKAQEQPKVQAFTGKKYTLQ